VQCTDEILLRMQRRSPTTPSRRRLHHAAGCPQVASDPDGPWTARAGGGRAWPYTCPVAVRCEDEATQTRFVVDFTFKTVTTGRGITVEMAGPERILRGAFVKYRGDTASALYFRMDDASRSALLRRPFPPEPASTASARGPTSATHLRRERAP